LATISVFSAYDMVIGKSLLQVNFSMFHFEPMVLT